MNLYDIFQNLYGLGIPVIEQKNWWSWGDVILAPSKVKNYKYLVITTL